MVQRRICSYKTPLAFIQNKITCRIFQSNSRILHKPIIQHHIINTSSHVVSTVESPYVLLLTPPSFNRVVWPRYPATLGAHEWVGDLHTNCQPSHYHYNMTCALSQQLVVSTIPSLLLFGCLFVEKQNKSNK